MGTVDGAAAQDPEECPRWGPRALVSCGKWGNEPVDK